MESVELLAEKSPDKHVMPQLANANAKLPPYLTSRIRELPLQ